MSREAAMAALLWRMGWQTNVCSDGRVLVERAGRPETFSSVEEAWKAVVGEMTPGEIDAAVVGVSESIKQASEHGKQLGDQMFLLMRERRRRQRRKS